VSLWRTRAAPGDTGLMSADEGYLPEPVRAWVQAKADKDHGGNFGAAAARILEAAYKAAGSPVNPWADLEAQMRGPNQSR
jgi:hypothetical protein